MFNARLSKGAGVLLLLGGRHTMPYTTTDGTKNHRRLIRRGFNSGSEYSVRVDNGHVILESPHLDKPLQITLTCLDELAREVGREDDIAYFIGGVEVDDL